MDLKRIGRYISEKRKAAGFTQKELAEKLGVTDKAVSKWETGGSLPDASLYMDLCSLLGISINELLAGEDINQENIERIAAENVLNISDDSKLKQLKLKRIIAALVAVVLIVSSLFVYSLLKKKKSEDLIISFSRQSAEIKAVELLSGDGNAFMFKYQISDEITYLNLRVYEYHNGERKQICTISSVGTDSINKCEEGMIALFIDAGNQNMKLVLATKGAKIVRDISILEDYDFSKPLGRGASTIYENKEIKYREEQGLIALFYSEDGFSQMPIESFEKGNPYSDEANRGEYTYYISAEFFKE